MEDLFNMNDVGAFRASEEPRLMMNLQLFAGDPVDWRKIMETQPPADADEGDLFESKPLFRTATDGGTGDPSDADEADDELEEEYDPIFMPRLNVTDGNLPYLSEGEMVIADDDGVLSTATVDDDGNLTVTTLQLDGDAIADGSISGSKLEENTITSRELDMDELFGDSALLNQVLSENIDAEALFENVEFTDLFDERHWMLANGMTIDGDTLDTLLAAGRYNCPTGVRSNKITGKPDDTAGWSQGFSVDVIRMMNIGDEQSLQQILRTDGQTWIRYGHGTDVIAWQPWILQTDKPQLDAKVDKAGDTMTGALTLNADPTEPLQAATKGYVDAHDAQLQQLLNQQSERMDGFATSAQLEDTQDRVDGKVSKSGDTMSGPLILVGNPTGDMEAVTKQYVDAKASATSTVGINQNNVTFLANASGAVIQTTSAVCKVIASTGTSKVLPVIGSVTGAPTGMSVALGAAVDNEVPITITVTANSTLGSASQVQGVLSVPILSPIMTTLTVQWSKVNQGAAGTQGSQGSQGPQGPQGPQGYQGPAGLSPSTYQVILSAGTTTWYLYIPGMGSYSTVFVSPDPTYSDAGYLAYGQSRVRCYYQTSNYLYFQASSALSTTTRVNVVWYS